MASGGGQAFNKVYEPPRGAATATYTGPVYHAAYLFDCNELPLVLI